MSPLVLTLALVGCDTSGGAGSTTTGGGSAKTTKTGKGDGHDHKDDHKHDGEKGHDHDHDHAHHGPHNGHIAEVGEEEYHIEWTHDEDGKIVVYILDAAAKKEVGVDQPSITIETKVGDDTNAYELTAVKPSEGAKASKFEIVDKELLGVVETLGEAVKATIKELKIGDKTFTDVKVEEHDHDHDH
jgi:hypothetical protein